MPISVRLTRPLPLSNETKLYRFLMSSYFGVVTCEGCSQKVSLAPEKVKVEGDRHLYECRRCMKFFKMPSDFEFKHPTKRDLSTEDAIRAMNSKGSVLTRFLSLFSR